MAAAAINPHVPVDEQLEGIRAADTGPQRHFWIVGGGDREVGRGVLAGKGGQ